MVKRASLARILPFAIYMAFIFIADMLDRLGWNAEQLRWLYGVKIAAVALALLYFWRDYVELRQSKLNWRLITASVLVGGVVMVLWVSLDAGWMSTGEGAGFDPRNGGRIDWILVAMRWCGAALVVPVMEELFWRSFLMRWISRPDFLTLRPADVKSVGFVVAVLLFGVEHTLWLAGIVAGVVYSVLYMRTQNLWTAIIAHATTNGVLGIWVVASGQWNYW
ncbi:CAAX prenyl protease-related protein [Duganella aceris]|uniref:CAAX prenyl protease-related protein n=1 Tax=Duganella aceris TaxID=2703883 RepID=A0ABX0FU91_9BURK|nr:CAAX prenyl protease-related protein [Duganella aceris]NGZ88042.1 CAAX prenyl protease-related protein [Duganella aceris]